MNIKRTQLNKGISITIVLVVILTLSNCTYDKYNNTTPPPVLPTTVSFSGDIQPLFVQYCATQGCHNNISRIAGLDLSASVAYHDLYSLRLVDTISPTNSFLYQQMTSGGTPMPPSGVLSAYDVDVVLKWIQQGGKNN